MIVFDLDGTLVDSAAEITEKMILAWKTVCPDRPFPKDQFHIGPPLIQSVAALAPELAPAQHEAIAAAFRALYDKSDLSATKPYAGILDLLAHLSGRGARMAIATNKRRLPTDLIVGRWFPGNFDRVACIDSVWPDDGTRPGTKVASLEWVVASSKMSPSAGIMVGDAASDIAAARAVGMRAIAVTWGYDPPEALRAAGPDELVHDVGALLRALTAAF
jgi:phosphoglycolate phosphatase